MKFNIVKLIGELDNTSFIILDKQYNYIFNRSIKLNVSVYLKVVYEALKNDKKFVFKIIDKYLPELCENTSVGTLMPFNERFEVLDIVNMPNKHLENQRVLNETKRRFAYLYNATIKDNKAKVDFIINKNIKQLAELIIWYNYLNQVQTAFSNQELENANKYITVKLMETNQVSRSTLFKDSCFYLDSLNKFKSNLVNYLNGVEKLINLPRLLSDAFLDSHERFYKTNVPISFELEYLFKLKKDYKYVDYVSYYKPLEYFNDCLTELMDKIRTTEKPLLKPIKQPTEAPTEAPTKAPTGTPFDLWFLSLNK